ncbi:hypothetical protein [Agrobacterium tumefaciens]|uniref:hypothetical protein n=1 Tax=Agrobacterium tumefaciens TaxID=358 RepID=UPI0021D1106E|nr:hypothetical protein [Agrobacterium tumefaciens]UXS04499.1 hypothetical protein FY156_23855 [Agrobacterium tumefaciens]
MLAEDNRRENQMDNMKLSELKVGHISGLALFLMGCFFFPFAMPFVGIIILGFMFIDFRHKQTMEKYRQQREDNIAEMKAQGEARYKAACEKPYRILAEIRAEREAANSKAA